MQSRTVESNKCYALLRSIMFFFNALFWLLGVATFSVGVAIQLDPEFRLAVSSYIPAAKVGANLFIVVGIAMVTTGFLGCCGAIRESQCMLLVFFLILCAVFASLIGAGIWAAASKERLSSLLTSELKRRAAAYHSDPASKEIMDEVQSLFRCCGVTDGAIDYTRTGAAVPITCSGGSSAAAAASSGCYHSIVNTLAANLEKLTGSGISIAFVVMLGMVLSMMMFCNLRDSQALTSRTDTRRH